ncbi:MAG: NAD(P)-binding domain-containing protein [Bacteroidota bacterium]
MKNSSDRPIGVIGAGNFGSAIANIIALNRKVILYARDEKVVEHILDKRTNKGQKMHDNIEPTHDLRYLAESCEVIFPIVPSSRFRSMMKDLSPFLHPYHMLIHGTKGFDIKLPKGETLESCKTSRS